jgi:hypothetical protein
MENSALQCLLKLHDYAVNTALYVYIQVLILVDYLVLLKIAAHQIPIKNSIFQEGNRSISRIDMHGKCRSSKASNRVEIRHHKAITQRCKKSTPGY